MNDTFSTPDGITEKTFKTVYGPVRSWRYGRSLGVDPIGAISTCSFSCVYCQLGAIERWVGDRRIYVPTDRIQQDLQDFAPWEVDVVTLSGSGEPTLAANLAEILTMIKSLTQCSTVVLTNGAHLGDRAVQEALGLADRVAVKLDAVNSDAWQRINRPVPGLQLAAVWEGILAFRQDYSGHLDVQTMILKPWSKNEETTYLDWMRQLQPHEIQLNTPTRPKPLKHELDARGNHPADVPMEMLPYDVRQLRPVEPTVLAAMGDRILQATGIAVRSPNLTAPSR